MTIILAVLKWIAILLLIILALLLVILLTVLLVPVRYRLRGKVNDPYEHEKAEFARWKDSANCTAEVTWLLRAVMARIHYPEKELKDMLDIRILGRRFPIEKFLGKKAPPKEEKEEPEEQEEKKELPERIEELLEKAENLLDTVGYYHRVLTGTCGRRAIDAVLFRLGEILRTIAPSSWFLRGAVGLGDPYNGGRLCGICSMLYPFAEERLQIETVWEAYRLDLNGSIEGGFRLGSIVRSALPLLFDKNCKKLLKKLRRGYRRTQAAKAAPAQENALSVPAEERGENG
ncbi:MAG: hypothetical protein IJG52_08870 [Lachnospiraceae bacterium]|nr:hypothetical protein [Lachnospiraceae bacterium]